MPRRKITLEEALEVVRQAGLAVQPVSDAAVVPISEPDKVLDYTQYPPKPRPSIEAQPVQVPRPREVHVVLYARHTIAAAANGGTMQAYGPGRCSVSPELADHLLHQDMLARQADDNMLSRQFKSYLVVEKVNSTGQKAAVGIPVHDGVLDDITSLERLGTHYTINIR